MMNVMEAIQKRRSIRKYKPDDIPDEVLNRLLEAMRLAPSGANAQAWKFIVVRDKTAKAKVANACQYSTSSGAINSQKWIREAPVIIVACVSEKEGSFRYYREREALIGYGGSLQVELAKAPFEYETIILYDLAIALDHLTLAAVAEGLGACWIAGMNEHKMKEILSVPDDVRAPLAMVLGYPDESPDPRPRKSLDEIICYDKYC